MDALNNTSVLKYKESIMREEIIIRDDRNLFHYILEIVAVWILVLFILIQTHFSIREILLDKQGGIYVLTIAIIILFRRGYGIYSVLTSDKEWIILENDKIIHLAKNTAINISNIGEIYLCSNSAMAAGFMRITTIRKVLFIFSSVIVAILSFEEIGIITFLITYVLAVKCLTKFIVSLIRKGGFEWRWYHLLVLIPKDNNNAVIITLDRQNITVIEQYLESMLQLSLPDIHKCFIPPSKKQNLQETVLRHHPMAHS